MDPDNEIIYFKKAEILKQFLDTASVKEAIAAYQHSYQLGFNHPLLFYVLGGCYKRLTENRDTTPSDREKYVNLSRENFQRVLEMDPESYPAMGNLADLEYNQGNFDEAMALYKKMYVSNRNNPVLLTRMGHTYIALGQPEEAIKLLRSATAIIASRKGTGDLHFKAVLLTMELDVKMYLAEAYIALGNIDPAIEELRRVLEITKVNINEDYSIPLDAYHRQAKEILNVIEKQQ